MCGKSTPNARITKRSAFHIRYFLPMKQVWLSNASVLGGAEVPDVPVADPRDLHDTYEAGRRMRALNVCSKPRGKWLLAFMLFVIPLFYFLHSLIVVQWHDHDLDSFLYLGSRLDSGELLYFDDFERKLPLLQYIFWL